MRLRFAGILFGALAMAGAAQASTYTDLHNFCSLSACADGGLSFADLVADGAGNFFGTTMIGGSGGQGVVFELSPNGPNWTYAVVYNFCTQAGCADGQGPNSPVILDSAGNIYGTTRQGGTGHGTVFELIPHGGGWRFKLLYAFCSQADCADGDDVMSAGLAYAGQRSGGRYDGISPLFGTTYQGGKYNSGTVFSLTPPAAGKKKWKQKVLFSFCKESGNCNKSGSFPSAGVIVDSLQTLYGTTSRGGKNGAGTIFQLADTGDKWKETVLYGFCKQFQCADGGLPQQLAENDAGELYGATNSGANQPTCGGSGCGTLFKLVPNGRHSTYTVLHAFCTAANCSDGFNPTGVVRLLGNGDIVGVTSKGGDFDFTQSGGGVIYSFSGGSFSVLHDFCTKVGCSDGSGPFGGPAVDDAGRIFGTTLQGGGNDGVLYEFAP